MKICAEKVHPPIVERTIDVYKGSYQRGIEQFSKYSVMLVKKRMVNLNPHPSYKS